MSQIEMTSYSRIKTQETDSEAVIPRGTMVSKRDHYHSNAKTSKDSSRTGGMECSSLHHQPQNSITGRAGSFVNYY
jgi:hypothetical protein